MDNTSKDMIEQIRKHNELLMEQLLKKFHHRLSILKLENTLKKPNLIVSPVE